MKQKKLLSVLDKQNSTFRGEAFTCLRQFLTYRAATITHYDLL